MGGWLAGLDAFVVGLAYLVALLTTRFVARPLILGLFGSAPFIGGWLSSRIDQALGDFERNITPAANASMGTIISALDWLTTQVSDVLTGASDLAGAVYERFYHLTTVVVPQVVGISVQWVEGLVEAAKGYALLQVQGLEARLGGEVARIEGETLTLVDSARSEALSEVQAAERIVLDEIRKAEQATGQLFLNAEHDAQQLVAASESKLADLVKAARDDLGAAVGAVEHDLQLLAQAERVALQDSVEVLGGDISAAEARGQAALSGLENQVKAEIEKVLASGPWSGLVALYEGGEEVLKRNVLSLALPAAKAIREQLANVEELRAKYGPEIAKAGEALKL